jgi:two-component system sensor histidine kinase UhpB
MRCALTSKARVDAEGLMAPDELQASTSVRRDLAVIAVATVLGAVVSVQFEVSEAIQAWARRWERYQLDEFPGIVLFAAVAFAWFVRRRVREVRAELARRIALERDLAAALAENRRLSQSHVRVQEEERRRLARELHDELGQHLNAIKIDAVSIRQCAADTSTEAHRAALSIIGITDHLHAIVRDMTRRLRPAGLDELGLHAALEDYVEAWRGRYPGLRVDLDVAGDFDPLPEALNITLYRFIQEGLTNVSRHAHASHVRIALERRAAGRGSEVLVSVRDDGSGAADIAATDGLGLIGMRERVEALGGRFAVVTGDREGFRVEASMPVEEPAP